MHIQLLDTIEAGNILGEGVLWNESQGAVWWTDIESNKIYSYHLDSRKLKVYVTPRRVCSFSFTKDQDQLLVAFDDGLAFFNPVTGKSSYLARPFDGIVGLRFNDGRTDPFGRFFVGTMTEVASEQAHQASGLYSLDGGFEINKHFGDVKIANAICWSPDGKLMYYADSPNQKISVFDFDENSGVLSNERLFATTSDMVFPDGAVTDAEGYLWNAQWGGSKIVRYAANGEIDLVLDVPVSQPTCVAFGGAKYDLLFVTSATQGLSESDLAQQNNAGHLFIYKTETKGVANTHFSGEPS